MFKYFIIKHLDFKEYTGRELINTNLSKPCEQKTIYKVRNVFLWTDYMQRE